MYAIRSYYDYRCMKSITVTINEKPLVMPIGSTVEDALIEAKVVDSCIKQSYESNPYIGALVNHELHSCSRTLVADCTLEGVRLFTDMGKRVYRHSICYLLFAAVSMLYRNNFV